MYYVPGPPLSEFVALMWYFHGQEIPKTTERVLPAGAVDLIIRLDSARTSHSGMHGPRTRSVVVTIGSGYELVGVHFKLGGAFPFLKFPVGDLQNASISIGDLWGDQNAQRLLFMLNEASSREEKFRVLEVWLSRLSDVHSIKHPAVTFAMRAFSSGSCGSAAEVADRTGYSQRHFIKLFRNQVGLKPKEFHRLRRFRRVIEAVQHKKIVDWVDIALSVGYFDQAHLIHDFRQFSDLAPEQYVRFRTSAVNHVRIPD